MANLEYRFWQIAPTVLSLLQKDVKKYRFEALASVLHSLARLNIAAGGMPGGEGAPRESSEEIRFGPKDALSADFGGLFAQCMREVDKFLPDVVYKKELRKREKELERAHAEERRRREQEERTEDGSNGSTSFSLDQDSQFGTNEIVLDKEAFLKEIVSQEEAHFWGQILFANVLVGFWDHRLPDIMRTACSFLETREDLEKAGWLCWSLSKNDWGWNSREV